MTLGGNFKVVWGRFSNPLFNIFLIPTITSFAFPSLPCFLAYLFPFLNLND